MVFKKNNRKGMFSIWIVTMTILLNFCSFLTPVNANIYSNHHEVQTEFFENGKAAVTVHEHTLVSVKRNTITKTKEKLNLYKLLTYNTCIKAKLAKCDKKVSFFKIPYTFKIIPFRDSNEPLYFNS